MKVVNEQDLDPDAARLHELLRQSRPAPDLRPGFQDAVWRRIERVEMPSEPGLLNAWLDFALARLLRPRLALVGVAAMLVIGASIGIWDGLSLSKQAAQERYLAAVSPLALRQ